MAKRPAHTPAEQAKPMRYGQDEERFAQRRQRRSRHDGSKSREALEVAERGLRRQERARRGPRMTHPPAEEPPGRYPGRGRGHTPEQSFKCGHCKRFIGPVPSGGRQRNHCPFCLYSRHVDAARPGDRANACGALMAPFGAFQRPNGEHCIVHRCLGCGFERFNRIAADDDFDRVLSLPVVPPRSAKRPSEPEGSGEEDMR